MHNFNYLTLLCEQVVCKTPLIYALRHTPTVFDVLFTELHMQTYVMPYYTRNFNRLKLGIISTERTMVIIHITSITMHLKCSSRQNILQSLILQS